MTRILVLLFASVFVTVVFLRPSLSSADSMSNTNELSNWVKSQNSFSSIQPNEDGRVPILEYHNITTSKKLGTYDYPATLLRQDLEWLYAHNYRPISLSDYVRGWIDVPAGKSPVVITFDDALSGQFSCLNNGSIDPNCAVGILDAIHSEHPDWATKATFFVLTNGRSGLPSPFSVPLEPGMPKQSRFAHFKMNYLVRDGYEIGNHTLHHSMKLRTMDVAQVEEEFVGGVLGIQNYLPKYDVQLLALPYGIYPVNPALVASGTTSTGSYHNICALAAGSQPAPSPMSWQFQPYMIPRIIPRNARLQPGGRFTIRYWLNHLELYPKEKFVSDGDPTTFTVPFQCVRDLDFVRLKTDHYKIRLYRGSKVVEYN